MTLNSLAPGQSAVIRTDDGGGALRQHFLDMSVIPGPQAQPTQQRKICPCRCFFTPQKGEEAPISMPADRCRMPASRN